MCEVRTCFFSVAPIVLLLLYIVHAVLSHLFRIVYLAWYWTYQIWLQAPCKFLASFLQVSCKFCHFKTCIWTGLDHFYLCTDILVYYVAWYRTWQAWLHAPYKLHTSSVQAPYKFCFQTCIRDVKKSNLYASCSAVPRKVWVLYWVYPSCPQIKLVHELYAVRQL